MEVAFLVGKNHFLLSLCQSAEMWCESGTYHCCASLSLFIWVCSPYICKLHAQKLSYWAAFKESGFENWFQFPLRPAALLTFIFQNFSFLTSDEMYCFGGLHPKSLQVQCSILTREHMQSFSMWHNAIVFVALFCHYIKLVLVSKEGNSKNIVSSQIFQIFYWTGLEALFPSKSHLTLMLWEERFAALHWYWKHRNQDVFL